MKPHPTVKTTPSGPSRVTLLSIALGLNLVPCLSRADADGSRIAWVNGTRIENAEAEPHNWLTHGRTYSEQRFSPLDQVNTDTVSNLGLAWYADFDTNRGQEATPIVVDGTMYVSTAWSKVVAFNAETGQELWDYDPEVPGEWAVNACCDVVNRGVAVWEGKVYVGSLDGRLIALDAATGREIWDVSTIDRSKPYTITGAPRVVKGKVLIGNGGAEFGVRGYVSAYDADTGELVWRFYTVPGNPDDGFENAAMEMAATTWHGQWWTLGGGGTVWDSMSYDPGLDLLYIGVGNGSPWNHTLRSDGVGDNLFLASIVALDPDDGSYVWHYQTSPGESWDHTATQQMTLADLVIDGEQRRVLMQAPKNGFFYVLDAATGKLISAEPFTEINWATHVDLATGRPVESPEARYDKTGEPFFSLQSPGGAHNWHSMSFSPLTGLVYIPIHNILFPFKALGKSKPKKLGSNQGTGRYSPADPEDKAQMEAKVYASSTGRLIAWDPIRQREVWRAEHPGPANGGTLATGGGLVFQGTGSGRFKAFDARSGEELWSAGTQTGVIAAPVTYMVGETQYLAIVVGRGGTWGMIGLPELAKGSILPNISRVLVFSLGGTDRLPEPPPPVKRVLSPPASAASAETISLGARTYQGYCFACHGPGAVNKGILPDLRYSAMLQSPELWAMIVRDGAFKARGMAGFGSEISAEEAEAIRSYVIHRANETAED